MKIKFLGATGEVTGSQTLITISEKNFLIDCGLYQGKKVDSYLKNKSFKFDPSTIDYVILSHAHIDHSGNLPNLVKKGFRGSIYATQATIDLCKIMLMDSAHLQKKEVELLNKIRKKQKLEPFEVIYDEEDVSQVLCQLIPVEYNNLIALTQNVKFKFIDAGHILGSSSIQFEIREKGRFYKLGYSGDIGRNGVPISTDPDILRDIDILIMESTYGNRHHSPYEGIEDKLVDIINKTVEKGGNLIIPAFAVGRTQHLVYVLHKLYNQNRIPEIPIFVDSPLSTEATKIYEKHLESMSREAYRIFLKDEEDPFQFKTLTYCNNISESQIINSTKGSCIIISSSGMAEGGRIIQHLENSVENKNNTILFVGYSAKNTLARKIMDGEKKVKINGKFYNVECHTEIVDVFSAHADRKDLLNYVKINDPKKLKNIFLIHGDLEQSKSLKDAIRSLGYQNVSYPGLDEIFEFTKNTW